MKWPRLLLSLTFLVTPLAAQDPPKWTTFVFQGENDALAAFGPSDEHYTNGVRFFGLRHPDDSPPWVDRFSEWFCGWACGQARRTVNSLGFAFGQLIYTPDDLSVPGLVADDRPYAGWLYVYWFSGKTTFGLPVLRNQHRLASAESKGSMIEQLPLPLVEDAGLQLVLLAQIGDGDFVGKMAAQDGGLLVGTEMAALTLAHGTPFGSVVWSRLESPINWSSTYGALLLQITADAASRQHAFELQVGVIGPGSGAEWAQSKIHELIDDEPPLGWDDQLPAEPGINLVYRYQRCLGLEASGRHFDLVPHAGGAVGTVMVMADAGATVRAGWNISGFPRTEIPTTVVATEKRRSWELYVFAGVDGRAVAHNVFLDGTVFRGSHRVDREDFVYDLRAGFSVRYKIWRLHYAVVRRSEEFTPRSGSFDGTHSFGSFTLGVERSF